MIAYKVVFKDSSGDLWSITKFRKRTNYRINEKAYPVKNTKLFVFSSVEAARKMAATNLYTEVWECEIPEPTEYKHRPAKYVHTREYVDVDWNYQTLFVPLETMFVDWVKLTKKVL